ncbi:hypothetical protein Mterra_01629 [Calidithermus terrae]|uniref:Uncharacterized protein n=1 Tax=Calidithermus terrae TaxID=1408545 RepID=A0A399EQJ8_9DEIN|nr:hypothetical protein [Calidithermus terrae]RIH85770.1 hypothetical protein Mterra_01629 [Calidithermus terrae]
MRLIGLLFLLCLAVFVYFRDAAAQPIARPPGVLCPLAPFQSAQNLPAAFEHEGYRLQPVARFALEARVLGKRLYGTDPGARLAPVDLALGWGRMSDSRVLEKVSISQGNRFYFWYTPDPPIPLQEIVVSSANMHMIPATPELEQRLKRLKSGNIVRLQGYLVNVSGPGGFFWNSSLTRDDTGNGACELVWVEELAVR